MTQDAYERGVFEGKVLAELEAIHRLGDEVRECLTRQGQRIGQLEKDAVRMKTMAGVAGAMGGAILTFLLKTLPGVKIN